MSIVPIMLIAVLGGLALLHFYWGVGGRWPGHDDRSLVGLVIGRTRSMRMPGFVACMMVTGALLFAALLVALRSNLIFADLGQSGVMLAEAGFWIACAVFALRGIAGFIPPVFAYAQGTRFEKLNVTLYSPLCLIIAAGFAVTGATFR